MSGASSCFPQGRWSGPTFGASASVPPRPLGGPEHPVVPRHTRRLRRLVRHSGAGLGHSRTRVGQSRAGVRHGHAWLGHIGVGPRLGLARGPPDGTAGTRHPRAGRGPARRGRHSRRRGDGRPQPRRRMLPPPPSFSDPAGAAPRARTCHAPGPGLVPPTGSPGPVKGMPDCPQAPSPCPPSRVADASPARRPRHGPRRRHRRLTSGHVPCDPALLGPGPTPACCPRHRAGRPRGRGHGTRIAQQPGL